MGSDLIEAEIEALQALAGQRPRSGTAREWLCLEELSSRGFCTNVYPRAMTPAGVAALEYATNTLDLRSRARIGTSFQHRRKPGR